MKELTWWEVTADVDTQPLPFIVYLQANSKHNALMFGETAIKKRAKTDNIKNIRVKEVVHEN